MKDYYDVLGVSQSSEPEVITAAYKAMMRKYHPDTNAGPTALERAMEINEAYEVLGDPAKRATYDAAREWRTSKAKAANPPPPPPPSPPPPPRPAPSEQRADSPSSWTDDSRSVVSSEKIPAKFLVFGVAVCLAALTAIWTNGRQVSLDGDAQSQVESAATGDVATGMASGCEAWPVATSPTGPRANDGLPLISNFVGKYPWEVVGSYSFMTHPSVREKLMNIFGANRDMAESVMSNNVVTSTIVRNGDTIIAKACEAHNCGAHVWAIHYNLKSDALDLCYYEEGTGPDGSGTTSEWLPSGRPALGDDPCGWRSDN